jgi:hypothetical protein
MTPVSFDLDPVGNDGLRWVIEPQQYLYGLDVLLVDGLPFASDPRVVRIGETAWVRLLEPAQSVVCKGVRL